MVATWWAAKKTPYLPSSAVGLMARRSPRKACGTFKGKSWKGPLATEGPRDFPRRALEAGIGLGRRYGAYDLMAVVFGFWQAFGHRPLARLIAAGRHLLV